MALGSCFCKKIQIEYTNEPVTSALCHCIDCRKLTGTLYTYSFVFKRSDLTITGSPKEVAKTSDSGNHIKNYFCPDCGVYCVINSESIVLANNYRGTPLYGHRIKPSGVPDEITIVRAGIFDDIEVLNQHKPTIEIYIGGRVGWLCPLDGVNQFIGMPLVKSND
ncbi:hypothetical protein AJ80_05970 [Polytolypa hystricis UAMH7299]|uniref:CENP-V/GFA domain-containing protein n=1 Tax=Polytolypa hystricis (strain UAMH7299) TaxID=1447883 RepID=A0A2B7XZD6_POLH7|nr:hypothetical protein AJ80_05970 [Polytolypa hystricis UAMH7299]